MSHPLIEISQPDRRPLYVELRETLEIGRECDGILIADGQASRRHASLSPRGGNVVLEDLGSTNGTHLDGTLISSAVVLMPGSVAQVGDTSLRIVGNEPAAVQPAAATPFGARETSVGAGAGTFGGAVKATPSAPAGSRETSMDAVARAVEQAPAVAVPVEQDHGTITIVFSDIENSTSRATSMGDAAWMKVLTEHNRIIAKHVDAWKGTIVKNQGDGFMLTFNGARQALRAMIGVQRELESLQEDTPDRAVRIRVGVHTGEVIAEEGDIFGKHVMLAARVGGLAGGGEIVVSSIVKEIAAARGDLEFGPPQVVSLKGIEGEHIVYSFFWQSFSDG